LLPLDKGDKQITQLGIARFIEKRCIVYTDSTACGACAEHCPTKAVHMIPYRHDLTIPQVNTTFCIGCGACEYACPVRPSRAIYVAGNPVHRQAEKPDGEQLNVDVTEDFPF
jgi:ferredoxin